MARYTADTAGRIRCPGCSGVGVLVAERSDVPCAVWTCEGCGGVFGVATVANATRWIAVDMPMVAQAADASIRYFDFLLVYPNSSSAYIHGWADAATRRIVQIG